MSKKNSTFAFFGEIFFKNHLYFHAIFEKFSPKNAKVRFFYIRGKTGVPLNETASALPLVIYDAKIFQVDDRGLYAPGQYWLTPKDVVGRGKGFVPFVGMVVILMNDYPKLTYTVHLDCYLYISIWLFLGTWLVRTFCSCTSGLIHFVFVIFVVFIKKIL